MTALIIQLLSGALGGNAAGALMKGSSLGTIGNSIAGIAGGGIGGTLLSMLGMGAAAGAGADADPLAITNLISSVASGGVGGGVLMAVIGMVKNMMNKG